LIAFGRPKGYRGSYKQWEEGNLAPQVVFEILSPGNRPDEMAFKFLFYERYGVEEYYIYDPDEGTLEGWLRQGDHLVKIPRMAGFESPCLGIIFEPGEGPDSLRIYRPDGMLFMKVSESIEKSEVGGRRADEERRRAEEQARIADEERRRAEEQARIAEEQARIADEERRRAEEQARIADEERRRAEEQTRRAEAADQRAERLAARLRELGIDPE
jgi:hypothetical protein